MEFELCAPFTYRIKRQGAMRVEARFFASPAILAGLEAENYASLEQLAAVVSLPGIVAPALAMPDIHWGYGFPIGGVAAFDPEAGGVVSPGGVGYDINCGVRLLGSSLTREDLLGKQAALADSLFAAIPSGLGSQQKQRLVPVSELDSVLQQGAGWAARNGFGNPDDLAHIESEGCLPGADPAGVSQRARSRGGNQLGTLGSGNHFLEVQYVDEIYDPEIAQGFGIFPGQVTVLIHTGSRGLGHQVCQEYVEQFLPKSAAYGIELPDRELAAAPIQSPDGQSYLGAMAAAANFAFANRQIIASLVRDSFEACGFSPKEHGLRLIYDLAHNNAKFEEHAGKRVLVHRKGATRAFGPGSDSIPTDYQSYGQPVLVPGDMGRYSFVLAGAQGAMEQSFGSCCHGAGRQWSRHRSQREMRPRNLPRELAEAGISLRAQSRATVDEEAPEAYKDVAEVVRVVAGAGLARLVARLKPMIVIKG